MTSFLDSKDIHGNLWPNWMVEKATREHTRKIIDTFNAVFADRKNLLYPRLEYKGLPLPADTPYFLIHNEEYKLEFSPMVISKGRRCTNEFCEISLAYTEASGYPALTGEGRGRITMVVAPLYTDKSMVAIYRLDVPMKLSEAALDFDREDKVEFFEEWDKPLRSVTPSRGPALLRTYPGLSTGRINDSPSYEKVRRPTLRKLAEDYGG